MLGIQLDIHNVETCRRTTWVTGDHDEHGGKWSHALRGADARSEISVRHCDRLLQHEMGHESTRSNKQHQETSQEKGLQ